MTTIQHMLMLRLGNSKTSLHIYTELEPKDLLHVHPLVLSGLVLVSVFCHSEDRTSKYAPTKRTYVLPSS